MGLPLGRGRFVSWKHHPITWLIATVIDFFTPYVVDRNFSSLAALGTYGLEMRFLSIQTGDPRYKQFAETILERILPLREGQKGYVWFPTSIPVREQKKRYMGSGADSFYEYLLKQHLLDPSSTDVLHNLYDFLFHHVPRVPLSLSIAVLVD